ncbi:hypothetical protein F4860DRAFT_54298 [Xylaria cubensis]|nr:hypothetical protein F4860DRAFT_54298 [Xylaria cubensis]
MHFARSIALAPTKPRNNSTTHDATKYSLMASQHSVQQLLALDDNAFIHFMMNIRDELGMFDISTVTNWMRTTETDQRSLEKRFSALGPLAMTNRPLDFSSLVEKLREIPPETENPSGESAFVPSSPSAGRLTSLPPQPNRPKDHQSRCYQWLVSDGCKPWCSLETLDEITENPEAHVELLQPWLGGEPVSSLRRLGLFSRQLQCWTDFRRWQRVNRGLSIVGEEDFTSFLDEYRRTMESKGFGQVTAQPDFETTIRRMWPNEQAARLWQWRRRREVLKGKFPEYAEAARVRLAHHGFTQSFELLEDAEKQDDRTTWIEYLEFECWTLDELRTPSRAKRGAKGPWESASFENRMSSQQLRVKWVLSQMPRDPEVPQSTAATQSKRTKANQASKKRKRDDEDELTKNARAATDEAVKRPIEKQKLP